MKKKIFIVVIIIIFLLFSFINKKSEIRVRVVANSNDACDMADKYRVRDYLINYFNNIDNSDYNNLREKIISDITYLDDELTNLINKEIDIDFNKYTLYHKSYDNNIIMDSKMDTLYIKINEAKGDNWWGIVYPKYIFDTNTLKYESLIYKWIKDDK